MHTSVRQESGDDQRVRQALALALGWRVLLAPSQEDVWFDQSLLDAEDTYRIWNNGCALCTRPAASS